MNMLYNKGLKRFASFLFDFLQDDYLSWKILASHFVPKKSTVTFLKASLPSPPSTKNPLLEKALTIGLEGKK
jgi:hypothetical protein